MALKSDIRPKHPIMCLTYKLLITLLIIHLFHQKVSTSGVFEFRLISFINELSRDAIGNCCGTGSTHKTDDNQICSEKCQTFFRVCLKHYQTNIDPSPPCTFGEVITTAFNESTVIIKDNTVNGLDHTIRFPFNFSWPGTFSLIVEAWHNASASMSTSSRAGPKTMTRTLITRLAMSRYLKVDNKWTQKSSVTNQTTLNYWYRVMCQENYFGEYCGALCKPRDDKYGHFSCGANGEKVCYAGWHGNYCEKAICRSGCNATNGECSQPNQCNCRYGWEGHNCNQCTKYPGCLHGFCDKPWDCLCDEGWGGLLCNQDLNYCTNHKPCKHGVCSNTGEGWYTCECPLGYTGKNCEQEIDSCAHLPCANGATCKSVSSNNYTCECPLGFSGKHCETMASLCTNNPCSHGGTCVDGPSGYLCICKVGYEGDNCQIKQTDCDPNPCTNGGSCVTTDDNNYSCICRAGFGGDNCEININDCEVNPCFSGTCIDEVNSFRCLCVPGFIGDLCQDNVDDCLTHPCSNGGSCIDLVNDYQCQCGPGFTGKDCSLNVNDCDPNPCLNEGRCVDGVDEYECECAPNYYGQRCELSTVLISSSQNVIESKPVSNNSNSTPLPIMSERAEALSSKQLIVIGFISASVPLIALCAAIAIIVCKHRKNKDLKSKRKDEDEARRQNEQNMLVTNMNNKCVDSHLLPQANVIVNALDRPPSLHHLNRSTLSKLTNHEIYDSKHNILYSNRLSLNDKSSTLQSLHKNQSNHKLLNTECTAVNNSTHSGPVVHKVVDQQIHQIQDNSPSNVVNHSPNHKIDSISQNNNNIERRGSLPHPQSVPNPLAKSESSINNSTLALNRTIDSINSQNNLHNNINIAAQLHRHRASGRSNNSVYVIEDHYSQPTYATVPEKLYATEV